MHQILKVPTIDVDHEFIKDDEGRELSDYKRCEMPCSSVLHVVCREGHFSIAEALLNAGAEVNAKSDSSNQSIKWGGTHEDSAEVTGLWSQYRSRK